MFLGKISTETDLMRFRLTMAYEESIRINTQATPQPFLEPSAQEQRRSS